MAQAKSKAAAKSKRAPATSNGWKTCSRGHKFRGAGTCPVCWPGGQTKKKQKKATAAKKKA